MSHSHGIYGCRRCSMSWSWGVVRQLVHSGFSEVNIFLNPSNSILSLLSSTTCGLRLPYPQFTGQEN